jgi:hypothetical protein
MIVEKLRRISEKFFARRLALSSIHRAADARIHQSKGRYLPKGRQSNPWNLLNLLEIPPPLDRIHLRYGETKHLLFLNVQRWLFYFLYCFIQDVD